MNPATIQEDNHRYVELTAIIPVADDDAGVVVTLVSAISSDPDTGTGQGDKPNDIVQVDLDSFLVRGELGKRTTSRMYTFTYRATDACGATNEASGTVTVEPRG